MTTTEPFDLDAIVYVLQRAAIPPISRELVGRLVAELERTDGDLAVAVREAGTARAGLARAERVLVVALREARTTRADVERLSALVAEVWDALHGNEQAVFKVAAAQQVITDSGLRSDHG